MHITLQHSPYKNDSQDPDGAVTHHPSIQLLRGRCCELRLVVQLDIAALTIKTWLTRPDGAVTHPASIQLQRGRCCELRLVVQLDIAALTIKTWLTRPRWRSYASAVNTVAKRSMLSAKR